MGSERWLHNHLVGHISFQKIELSVLGVTLSSVNCFTSYVKHLVANYHLDSAIRPLNEFGIADHSLQSD